MSLSQMRNTSDRTKDLSSGAPLHAGAATLEKVAGIYVAHLRGSYEEMGRQHAELAMQACGDVTYRYLERLIEKLVAHAIRPLGRPAGTLLKRLFHLRNAAKLGDEMGDLLRGCAHALDLSPAGAERTFLVPDILHYLVGRSFVPLAFPPMCSGAYAAGAATKDRKQLICRNFDFFGRGTWNECNAIIVMRPNEGQKVCWIGALGSPVGPQGINESGLFFGLHTNFTRDVCTKGVPLFTLCNRIMAQCTTLEEAIACIRTERRLCGLSLFLVDTKAHQAAAVGFSANHDEVVYAQDNLLVRTNHYTTKPMQEHEIAPHPWQLNSKGRFRRIHELLDERCGELMASDMSRILSDCTDTWENCQRVTGNIVACVNTTQSLVLCPEDDALWLAHADHPVSHASNYAGFSLNALFAADGDYAREALTGRSPLGRAEHAALSEYVEAWSAYFDHLDNNAAVFRLRRAAEHLPDEPIFPRMAGLLLMKEHRYAQALPLLLRNCDYAYADDLAKAEAHVWAGRCLDLLHDHKAARIHYENARDLNASPVSQAADRHLTRPFKRRELLNVAPEFICGTAVSRYKKG